MATHPPRPSPRALLQELVDQILALTRRQPGWWAFLGVVLAATYVGQAWGVEAGAMGAVQRRAFEGLLLLGFGAYFLDAAWVMARGRYRPLDQHLALTFGWFGGLHLALVGLRLPAAEPALAWLLAHPLLLLGGSVAGVVGAAYAAVRAAAYRSPDAPEPPERDPAAFDAHRTAVHEAGHALFLALRATPDPTAELRVRRTEDDPALRPDQDGLVALTMGTAEARRETSLVFRMRMSLAGILAERRVLGAATKGGGGDQESWLVLAVEYLANGFGEPFFRAPVDAEQRATNLEALRRLRARHDTEVAAFLAANHDVLLALAAAAWQERALDAAALAPFLEKVTVPEGWRLPPA